MRITVGPRWHINTPADGDTHWGELDEHGYLRAPCGAVFRSIPTWYGQPPGMDHLPDFAQGCRICVEANAHMSVEAAS